MRVKSVPRHLPRRECLTGLVNVMKIKSAVANFELFSFKKEQENDFVSVKTVNFTNYYDIVRGVNLPLDLTLDLSLPNKTSITEDDCFIEWKPLSPPEERLEALDLSMKTLGEPCLPIKTQVELEAARPLSDKDNFKDTCLYQLMTDPDFLKRIAQNKQAPRSSCPYCKEEFNCEADMKQHLNVQADAANQLTCCACGKTFAQKRYLRYHQRCHSERNKFACEICTRKYSRLDNLTRHNIFHTNPDKFPCTSCERTFARKDLLNKHLKCHENKYKYFCHFCQKYFKGPVSLENHIKVFHSTSKTASLADSSAFCLSITHGKKH